MCREDSPNWIAGKIFCCHEVATLTNTGTTVRVLIVGSGLLGVMTAYFLSRDGHEVCVIDRQGGPGLETSYANGGMLTPSQANPWNEPGIFWRLLRYLGREDSPLLLRLSALPSLFGWGIEFLRNSTPERYHANLARNARIAEYSLKVLQNLRAEHKLPYDHGTEGTMKIFRERRALDTTAQLAEQLQQHGVQCHIIDTNAAIEVEPAIAPLKDEIVGAAFYPHDEHGDAFQFCAAMSDYAQQAGAEFRFNTTVTGLQGDPTAMTGVRTTSGVLTADAYVLAAGSHTPTLAKELELEIPVRPVKGYSVTTRLNGWSEPPKLPVIDEALHAGVTPLGDRLRSVGTAEFAGYDSRLNARRITNLLDLLVRIYPQYEPFLRRDSVQEWAGLRPMSSDGGPILGRSPVRNLFINTGHGHLGWSMCAGSGKAVADVIAGREPDIDMAPYNINRFETN